MKKRTLRIFVIIFFFNSLFTVLYNTNSFSSHKQSSFYLYSLRRTKEAAIPQSFRGIVQSILDITKGVFGDLAQCVKFGSRAISALQYGDSQGFEFLRKQIAIMANNSGIRANAQRNISVFDGFIEMRKALGLLFVNPQDQILYQANSSLTAEMLKPLGGEQIAFDFNRSLYDLEEKLQSGKVKIIYLLSDTLVGEAITPENKQRLYDVAKNYNVVIVEDASFRTQAEEKSVTLKSLDVDDSVVYLDDLSHLIGAGLRTSFAIAPYEIMKKMELAKQGFTLHPNCISQVILSEFIRRNLGISPDSYQAENFVIDETNSFTEANVKSLLAKTGKNIWPSVIRQILKVVQDPSIISLAGGMPAPELFPFEAMSKILENLTDEEWQAVLKEAPAKGLPQLLEAIKGWLGVRGIAGDVLVTDGSQQGLDLIGQMLGKYGEKVKIITDLPTYLGALSGFAPYLNNAREQIRHFDLETLLSTQEGRVQLKEAIQAMQESGDRVVFYLTPTFGNPSGKIMSLEHRQAILSLAKELGIQIFEDDPYGEVRWYEGERMPSLRQLDNNGDTVTYMTSNSKVCCPGLRIGYIIGSSVIIDELAQIKADTSGPANSLSQMLTAKFISSGALDQHVENVLIPEYERRAQTMVRALKEYMPEGVSFTEAQGGLFVWVTLPEGINTTNLLNKLAKDGIEIQGETVKVAFVPGTPFNTDEEKLLNCMRLNFSNVGVEKIIKGVRALAEAVKQELLKLQVQP